MKRLDCNACSRRKQLCSRRLCIAANQYANQDYVGQREDPFSWIKGCIPEQIPNDHNAFLMAIPSTKLLIAKLFFVHHLKQSEIADLTYKSKQYISRVIADYKTKKTQIKAKSTVLYKGGIIKRRKAPSLIRSE